MHLTETLFAMRHRKLTLTLTVTINPNLNPNSNTDPNPNPKNSNDVCSKRRHQNEFQHSVIYKSYFPRDGFGLIKGL